MEDVYLVGVSMTPFGKFLDKSVKDLTREAVEAALTDAGATREDIGAAWFSNTTQGVIEGQYCVPGEIALRDMGFQGIAMTNVENACASASTAWRAASVGLMSESACARLASTCAPPLPRSCAARARSSNSSSKACGGAMKLPASG